MLAVKQVEMPQTSSDKDNETQSNVVNALKGEINMLQDFDHVNIVQFLGYNESPEYLSIFLEYVSRGLWFSSFFDLIRCWTGSWWQHWTMHSQTLRCDEEGLRGVAYQGLHGPDSVWPGLPP